MCLPRAFMRVLLAAAFSQRAMLSALDSIRLQLTNVAAAAAPREPQSRIQLVHEYCNTVHML